MEDAIKVVIVGGVACGTKTASRFRRLMPEAQITLLDRGEVLSFGACGLPYYVSGDVDRLDALVETPVGVKRDPVFFKKVKGFDALTGVEAVRIDRERKTVETISSGTGETGSLAYDKLVLATGAKAFVPPIPGRDLKGVYTMHRMEDASRVQGLVEQKEVKKAVVVGGGLIGLEMVEALRMKGVDVTLVEMLPTVMGLLLDEEVGRLAMAHMRQKGVTLRTQESVKALLDAGNGQVRAVQTDKGEIEADLVLMAVGVRPFSGLAQQAGLSLDQKGGVLVNSFCQTSDPDIYAGGDCVSNACAVGLNEGGVFAPQGSTANKHGRVIANHIAGRSERFPGVLATVICKVFDMTVGRSGLSETQARALGCDVESVLWAGPDRPHYMPGSGPLCIKLVVDRGTRRLIGFQGVGMGDVAKRLDVAATAMSCRADLDTLVHVDLGYAPPYSPPLDPIITAAHILQNKLDGLARSLDPLTLRKRLEDGHDGLLLLDVRGPAERNEVLLPYEDRTRHIPLGALRERLEELPRDKLIVPFCKVSLRGYEAERILTSAGFESVAFLEGGIVGWPFEKVVPGAPSAS